jgi:restriction system protein
MGRRKDSILKDVFDLTAMLPWWVGVVLAAVSYFLIHYISTIQVEQVAGLDVLGPYFFKQLAVNLSKYLQFIMPSIFLLGALYSLILGQRKNKLYSSVKNNPKRQALLEMDWQEFELLVGKYFETKGYTVKQLPLSGPDGGVDLVAIKDGERYLVQCKQWRSTSVGVKIVRELLGVISATGAVGGFVVSSGKFTRDAEAFARGRNIELIDGEKMVSTIGSDVSSNSLEVADESETHIPTCPKCGSAMVIRLAKKGVNAGNEFWGCSTYPKCKGTVSI